MRASRHFAFGTALVALVAFALMTGASASRATTTSKSHATHRISAASARSIAEARVPGGKVKSHELEKEGGRWIYSYDFVVPGKKGVEEVHVDAKTGKVLTVHHETAAKERHEKALEKKEYPTDTTSH